MTTSSPSPDPAPGPADLALPITDAGLARRLGERMAEVEEALFGHAVSRAPYVTTAAQHLLSAGGKRFRPLLVLLAAEAGEHPVSDDVITAAGVVEITQVGIGRLRREIESAFPERPFTVVFWDGSELPATGGEGPTFTVRSPQAVAHALRRRLVDSDS